MRASLEHLLEGVIDYAGIFPPAKLEMREALENYLRYQTGPERWLVSRFVCSTARLKELAEHLEALPAAAAIPVSAVASSPPKDRGAWEDNLAHDATAMNDFQKLAGERAEIVAYETRVPDLEQVALYARDLKGFDEVDVFVELPWGAGLPEAVGALAETEWLGAKGRTGGAAPEAFPSAEAVAELIHQCVSLDVPFKLTAGLHDPLPNRETQIGADAHGFLNVLGGAALALAQDLSPAEVAAVLRASEASSWSFQDDGFAYRGLEVSLEEIDEARSILVAIGSCSVLEPLEGLAALGLGGNPPAKGSH